MAAFYLTGSGLCARTHPMDKHQVADALDEIALLLELVGENPFKARAYANAARTLRGAGEDLERLVADHRLGELKGFGETLVEKVTELATTGQMRYWEEL